MEQFLTWMGSVLPGMHAGTGYEIMKLREGYRISKVEDAKAAAKKLKKPAAKTAKKAAKRR